MWLDSVKPYAMARNVIQVPIVRIGIHPPEASASDVGQPWGKTISQQAEETKHDVAVSAGVRHDLGRLQFSLLIQNDGQQHQAVSQRSWNGDGI